VVSAYADGSHCIFTYIRLDASVFVCAADTGAAAASDNSRAWQHRADQQGASFMVEGHNHSTTLGFENWTAEDGSSVQTNKVQTLFGQHHVTSYKYYASAAARRCTYA
jgi:hypothetical protein